MQTVIPRPIAWVLTENENGSHNLAPFSFFNVVSSRPPLLSIAIGPKAEGMPKDTLANIERDGRLVIHIAQRALAEAVNESARVLEAGESEVERIGLATRPFADFGLPRVSDAHIAFACERFEVHRIVGGTQTLVLARIQQLYVADALAERDAKDRLRLDPKAIDPLCRLGGTEYAELGKIFSLARPR
ncbi:flavin reductase family protein [Alkalilimnicola ehrlichii]|uniref:flavin reductase family protein n=1 Tax=Alkalilimnicola ehrlichii TaxID=351052 RepID=UPI001C6E32BD|nr:flavin reductase family protein [Alkalilimnicola ehrlichii]